jgi:TrmH family RNA methyltransferase
VHELLVTEAAASRHGGLVELAAASGATVCTVTEKTAAGLCETVTPQGVVAVCDLLDVSLERALAGRPRLVAVLAGVADPGNAGTVLRTADAAGADAVIFAGDTVDPHNGKVVRASAGSLFHLPTVCGPAVPEVFAACRAAGLRLVGAAGDAPREITGAPELAEPTAWVFGSEAAGLAPQAARAVDAVLSVPIYGGAESLNLAAAAAVCLYASARAQRTAIAGGETGYR